MQGDAGARGVHAGAVCASGGAPAAPRDCDDREPSKSPAAVPDASCGSGVAMGVVAASASLGTTTNGLRHDGVSCAAGEAAQQPGVFAADPNGQLPPSHAPQPSDECALHSSRAPSRARGTPEATVSEASAAAAGACGRVSAGVGSASGTADASADELSAADVAGASGGEAASSEGRARSSEAEGANASAEVVAEDEDRVFGLEVIATSCAHGPLVTHPECSMPKSNLASVFQTSNESWLYVLMEGEFGAPWPMAITRSGVCCGRLYFKARMQQWALMATDASHWSMLDLKTVIPLMIRAWGELRPPTRESRWICFPYLSQLPPSVVDLSARFALGDISPQLPADLLAQLPASATAVPDEAVVQRDVKAIGACPPPGRNQQRAARRKHKAAAPSTSAPAARHAISPSMRPATAGMNPAAALSLPVTSSAALGASPLAAAPGAPMPAASAARPSAAHTAWLRQAGWRTTALRSRMAAGPSRCLRFRTIP